MRSSYKPSTQQTAIEKPKAHLMRHRLLRIVRNSP